MFHTIRLEFNRKHLLTLSSFSLCNNKDLDLKDIHVDKSYNKNLGLIPLASFWVIRKERNRRVFESI